MVMIYLAVYTYIQPYRKFYINILETVLVILILILMMLIIISTGSFEVSNLFICTCIIFIHTQHSIFGEKYSNYDIDHCGDVNTISKYAAILIIIPFYYFPLVILVIVIIKKIANRILTIQYVILKCNQHCNVAIVAVFI